MDLKPSFTLFSQGFRFFRDVLKAKLHLKLVKVSALCKAIYFLFSTELIEVFFCFEGVLFFLNLSEGIDTRLCIAGLSSLVVLGLSDEKPRLFMLL